MIDYAAIAEDALAAIREAGTKLPARRVTSSVNGVTSVVTATTSAQGDFDGVVLPAKRNPFTASLNDADVENLRTGKIRKLLLAAAGAPFAPEPDDIFTFEGYDWAVRGCTPISPAGTPVIFTVEVLRK